MLRGRELFVGSGCFLRQSRTVYRAERIIRSICYFLSRLCRDSLSKGLCGPRRPLSLRGIWRVSWMSLCSGHLPATSSAVRAHRGPLPLPCRGPRRQLVHLEVHWRRHFRGAHRQSRPSGSAAAGCFLMDVLPVSRFSVDRGLRFQSRLFVVRAAPAKPRIRTPQFVISFGQDSRPRGAAQTQNSKDFKHNPRPVRNYDTCKNIISGRLWAT